MHAHPRATPVGICWGLVVSICACSARAQCTSSNWPYIISSVEGITQNSRSLKLTLHEQNATDHAVQPVNVAASSANLSYDHAQRSQRSWLHATACMSAAACETAASVRVARQGPAVPGACARQQTPAAVHQQEQLQEPQGVPDAVSCRCGCWPSGGSRSAETPHAQHHRRRS